MKLNQSIYIILLAITTLSCRKERDLTYQGPDVVEFSNPITGVNSKLAGQSIGGTSVVGDNANIPIRGDRDSIIIQLVGPQRAQAIDIDYTVVPGTAVEGTDYEILGTRGKVTIPANASATAIQVRLLNTSTTSTNVRTVSFRISNTSVGDVGVSENYRTYALSIFPMKAYVNKVISAQSGSQGSYFASSTGQVYTSTMGAGVAADVAYTVVSRVVSGVTTLVPVFISPETLSGNVAASATKFSARVFVPAATVPAYLQSSWATTQLGTVTAVTVAAIPVTGATAAAAVSNSVDIVENGIYGFVNESGKKGYIRVKTITAGISGAVTFDVMAQP